LASRTDGDDKAAGNTLFNYAFAVLLVFSDNHVGGCQVSVQNDCWCVGHAGYNVFGACLQRRWLDWVAALEGNVAARVKNNTDGCTPCGCIGVGTLAT